MHMPEFEPYLGEGLVALGLPQPRRGINLRSVLDTLLLENKHLLLSWAVKTYSGRISWVHGRKLASMFDADVFRSTRGDGNLSTRQWAMLRDRLLLRLNEEHRKYKRSQTVLFRRYQTLLHKMVNRQVFNPDKRQDAYQEASIGLIHAIDKVADSKASFSSYARTWISRHIRNYLMEEHFPVHVPINLASRILRHNSEAGEGAEPLSENLQNLAKPGVSIDESSDDDGDSKPRQYEDQSCKRPSDAFLEKDLHNLLHSCINELTEKQREVLALRYGLSDNKGSRTLARIASEVGISHQQVSMREKRALQKLESVMRPMLHEIGR